MAAVYLIPTILAEGKLEPIPAYTLEVIKKCNVLFVENEKAARRYLKLLDKTIVIDDYKWYPIHKAEEAQINQFKAEIKANAIIGIMSDAGCPGIADPGQVLVFEAQQMNVPVFPLTGPSSILLALMASGLNGQQFEFCGYLSITPTERQKKIKELELSSVRNQSTKIFIETPYRNNSLLQSLLQYAAPETLLCIAIDITSDNESIKTKPIKEWKKIKPELPKAPAIFLLYSK